MVRRATLKHAAAALWAALLLAPALAGAQTFRALGRLEAPGYSYFASSAEARGEINITTTSPTGYLLRLSSATGLPAQDVFRVTNGGLMGAGPLHPAAGVHVSSAAGTAGDMMVVSTGTSNVIRMTGAGEIYATRFYGFGGLMGNIPSNDEMGNHTATTTLNMSGWPIKSASTLYAQVAPAGPLSLAVSTSATAYQLRVFNDGQTAIGPQTADDTLHVLGQLRLDNNADTMNRGCFRYNGTNLQYANDCANFINITQTTTNGWTDGGTVVYPTTIADLVGVGTHLPEQDLDVEGVLQVRRLSDANSVDILTDSNILRFQGQYKIYTSAAVTTYMGMQTNSTGQPGARLKIGAGAAVNELFTVGDYRVGIGTGAPTAEVDVVGGNVESSSNTAGNGSEALPAYTFTGNTNTGFYLPGASQFAFSLGGTARFSMNSSDISLTTPWQGPLGAVGAPAYSFSASPTTGLYAAAATLYAGTAGVLRLTLNATAFTATLPFRGQNGTLAAPAYSFSGDTNTGIYRPGTDSLGLVVGGNEPIRMTSSGVGLRTTAPEQAFDIHAGTVQVRRVADATAVGTLQNSNLLQFQGAYWTTVSNNVAMRLRNMPSAVTPQYRLSVEDNAGTGILNVRNDGRVSISNTTFAQMLEVTGDIKSGGQFLPSMGAAAAPAYAFTADTNTGVYAIGGAQLALTAGGLSPRLHFGATAITPYVPWRGQNGTVGAPALSFSGDTNTGIYNSAAVLYFPTAGVSRLSIDATDIQPTIPLRGVDGTASAQPYSFTSDTNLGFYRAAADELAFTPGGTEVIRILSDGMVGLKTPAPEEAFDIHAGTVQARRLADATAVATIQNSNLLNFQGAYWTTVSNNINMQMLNVVSAAVPTYRMAIRNNAATEILGLRNDGRVAISNTAFAQHLDVTGNMQFSGQLLMPAGSVDPPSYAFTAESGLGFFNPGPDRLGFASNVVNTLEINTSEIKPQMYWRGQSGSAAIPALSFSGDTDTGMYYAATLLGFATLGTARLTVDADSVNPTVSLYGRDGAKTAPAFTFYNDTDTGFYKPSDGFLGVTASGNETFRVGSSSVTSTVPWRGINGTAASPTFAFSAEDGNGIYGGAVLDSMYLATNGGERLRFNATIATCAVVMAGDAAGSAALPSFSFSAATDAGMYSPAADTLALATEGVERVRIDASGNAGFGLGGAAPAQRVDVGGGNLQVRRLSDATSGATLKNSSVLLLQGSYWTTVPSVQVAMRLQNVVTAATPRYKLSVQEDGGTERFLVRDDGYVGISSATPMYEVSVTGDVNSSGVRYAGLGSVAAPAYSFFLDQNTGVYSPGAEQLAFAANGTRVMLVDTAKIEIPGNWSGAAGAVGTPGYSFNSDPNTGIYHSAAETINFGLGGVLRLTLNNLTELSSTLALNTGVDGSASAPAFAFTSQTNTGIYRAGAATLGVAIAGDTPLTISDSLINSAHVWMLPAGTAADPALAFNNNDNTGFFRPAARILAISGAGTQRFSVDVGMSSGTLPLRGAAGTAAAPTFSFLGKTDTGMYRPAANNIGFATGGVPRMRIDGSGNAGFGLGTAAPTARVDVGGGNLLVRRIANGTSGVTMQNSNRLQLQGSYFVLAAANRSMQLQNVVTATTPRYKLSVQDNANAERFVVTDQGLVGVSTAAPAKTLGVTGNIQVDGSLLSEAGTAAVPPYSFYNDSNTGIYSPGAGQLAFSAGGTQALWLDANTITHLGPWVAPNGAVGTPAYSFASDPNTGVYWAVADNLHFATGGVLRLTLTTASQLLSTLPLINVQGSASAPAFSFMNDTNTGVFSPGAGKLAFATAGVERMRITSTGVGIGLGGADPSYELQLGADSAAKPSGNTWTVYSDARLKKDIRPIERALQKLTSLEGVTYRWRDPAAHGNLAGTYMGFIAQDAEKVFPEWVGTDSRGYKNLNTIGFMGLVPEALRELKHRNAVVRQKLDAQKARLESLQERLR